MRVFSSASMLRSTATQLPIWASSCAPRRGPCRGPLFLRRSLMTPTWQAEPQSLSANRTLSYPATALYDIIADVSSYSTFLPYCTSSTITRWTGPDKDGRRWPCEAEMRVGWAGLEERVVSRIYCQPGTVLEAISGEAQTTIRDEDLPPPGEKGEGAPSHAPSSSSDSAAADTSLFKYLFTRWTIRPFPFKPPAETDNPLDGTAQAPAYEKSDVSLKLEFQFANPVYAAMSKAVTPRVASIMIEAFEKRAAELNPPSSQTQQHHDGHTPPDGQEKKSVIEGVIPDDTMRQTP